MIFRLFVILDIAEKTIALLTIKKNSTVHPVISILYVAFC